MEKEFKKKKISVLRVRPAVIHLHDNLICFNIGIVAIIAR